jgi:hypothetical protein
MSGEKLLSKSYRNAANVMVGKLTVVVVDNSVYTDGFRVPTAANDGPIAGVLLESILPNGFQDYRGGQYIIASGTAWPTGAIPDSGLGLYAGVWVEGICHVIAAGAITRGDRVNVADSQGRIKTINEVAGSLVYAPRRAT